MKHQVAGVGNYGCVVDTIGYIFGINVRRYTAPFLTKSVQTNFGNQLPINVTLCYNYTTFLEL